MIEFNKDEYESICNIIDNIIEIEYWQNNWIELGKPDKHIYLDIKLVSGALTEFKYKSDSERQLQLREKQS